MTDKILDTRTSILKASRELFLQKGYHETSMQDIMKVLSISKWGIYHHFHSKDEILAELILEEASPLLTKAREIFEDTTLIIQKRFIAWIEAKNAFYRDRFGLLRRVFVEKAEPELSFRIIGQLKELIKPIIENALASEKNPPPGLRETANLMLCAHELVFSYWLKEIQDEKEFETYLNTVKTLAIKVFS